MRHRSGADDARWWNVGVMSGVVAMSLCASVAVSAQEVRRLDPGTTISVRTNDTIDVDRQDNRVYAGIVDQDVRGNEGRILIPRGSPVELFVRLARDNDLILDLESVVANGVRYAVKTDPNRVESRPTTAPRRCNRWSHSWRRGPRSSGEDSSGLCHQLSFGTSARCRSRRSRCYARRPALPRLLS